MLPLRAASTISQCLSPAIRTLKPTFKQMSCTNNPIPSWSQLDRQQAHQRHCRGHKVNHSVPAVKQLIFPGSTAQGPHRTHELRKSTYTEYILKSGVFPHSKDALVFFHKICLNNQIIQIYDFPSFILLIYTGAQIQAKI